MSKPLLTKKQEEIFIYIKDYILKKGYPPTVREIGAAVGFYIFNTSSFGNINQKRLHKKRPLKA